MHFRSRPGQRLGDYPTPEPDTQNRPSPAAPVTLATIPDGFPGTRETLRIMRDFARASVRNPDQTIRGKALELLSGLPPRQRLAEIKACHAFVRDQIRYVNDPVDVELVQTPESTLQIGQGDCDDKATLLAGLLTAVGHPCQFCAVGFGGGPLSHVLVETRMHQGWMPLETIIPREAGWFPDGVTSAYRLKV